MYALVVKSWDVDAEMLSRSFVMIYTFHPAK